MNGGAVVEAVAALCRQRRPADTERALAVLRRHHPWAFRTLPDPEALGAEFRRFPVTVNFHPDRIARDGRTTAAALLADGLFRTQYETGISAGSLTAHPGGDRDRWESKVLGLDAIHPDDRPRYGTLNLARWGDGGAPRFGSCVLELSPKVLPRSTFSMGDTHRLPEDLGTADEPMAVLAGLLEDADATGSALNLPNGSVGGIVDVLRSPRPPRNAATLGRTLDGYVEAQIHGPVALDADVAALTLDPSYRGTEIGDQLAALAPRYGILVRWHPGYALDPADVPDDFRGPEIPEVAREVEKQWGSPITAQTVGRAAAATQDPGRLQQLKYLWHCVVRFGLPLL